ncbi:integrase arm-type DNA-binding domain-containing protein [Geomonas paludis]|uniref:Integrase arm-type DNA-binding domain-containing protein n=1 Tax=Geomonas paludis TaxID=2740185 RepID=A0ABY4LIY4_9BACT|nr:site-specific integrase [Geomonas paludis]UPU37799.1 integrase arm-type DNA-binding domain-containing protein [Geomonas paludis]
MARSKSMTFTDTMVRKLKPEAGKYTRGEGNGFTIRVMPSGIKTWLYIYIIQDKRREMNLGNYPEVTLETARAKFKAARTKVKNKIDPMAENLETAEVVEAEPEPKHDLTFDELAKEYIASNVEGQLVDVSVYSIKRILLRSERKGAVDDFKQWRTRKVSTITTEDAAKLVKEVSLRSAAAARNIIKTARPMFSYAKARRMISSNPFILGDVKSFLSRPVQSRLEPTIKSRTFSEDEIRHFWTTLSEISASSTAKNALRLILLTGQRPSEVLGLHSDEINGHWWTLPKERTKARYDKNREDHKIYLLPEALALIGGKEGYIFESRVKSRKGAAPKSTPISVNALGHTIYVNNYLGLAPWGAHDLRRTCRTFMSDIDGISAKAAEATLNHAKQGVLKNYDQHKYERQIQNALTLWRDKLVEIIGGPLLPELPDNVIPIRRNIGVAE